MSKKKTTATKRGRDLVTGWKPATDDELDSLAEISDQDIEEAKAFAREHGSPLFNQLLNADKSNT